MQTSCKVKYKGYYFTEKRNMGYTEISDDVCDSYRQKYIVIDKKHDLVEYLKENGFRLSLRTLYCYTSTDKKIKKEWKSCFCENV